MFERALARLAPHAFRRLTKEVRDVRLAIEALTDTIREINKLPPIYRELEPVAQVKDYESFIQPGDHLTYWILEELAKEHGIPIEETTNLETLAKDRGWVDAGGNLVMLPASAHAYGLTLDGWRDITKAGIEP